ncbi:BTAD domain-containing putative transcriptional regulator [Streptomyces diastatochromogenes]|nr:BTAD domain-containing putative transcriptional regulator [Streptomyces diastatochromogenes]
MRWTSGSSAASPWRSGTVRSPPGRGGCARPGACSNCCACRRAIRCTGNGSTTCCGRTSTGQPRRTTCTRCCTPCGAHWRPQGRRGRSRPPRRPGGARTRRRCRIDLDAFEETARRAADGGGAEDYRAALALADAGLLPEDRYEPWASEAAEALEARRTALRLGLGETLERDHHTAEAIDVLRALIAQNPLHEPGHRALMRVLADAGQRREALADYEDLRDELRRDTGADPDPLTRRLYRELLSDSVEARDQRPAPRHRLPAPATALIGREREMAEVEKLLGRGRLLTLTGAGGCGKTRLALAVAARRGDGYRDGAWFVDLAGLAEPHLVPEAVAAALGLQLLPSGGGRRR